MIGVGIYPDTPLKLAREKVGDARKLLAAGIDPSGNRQAERIARGNTFELVAREWLALQKKKLAVRTYEKAVWMLETMVYPYLGSRPVDKILASDVLKSLKRIESRGLIDIRLHTVRQFFRTLDPAPFREKDLDELAEQYLVDACAEAGTHWRLRIIVHPSEAEAESEVVRTRSDSVHNYFVYREQQLHADILRLLRYGAVSFVIGVLFLIVLDSLPGAAVGSSWRIQSVSIGISLTRAFSFWDGMRYGGRLRRCFTTGGC